MDFITIFGTFASVIIAISLTMKNIKTLRLVNFVGAMLFAVYGYFIGSIPVVIVNLLIAIIDIYFYIPLITNREKFDFITNSSETKYYSELFIKHYKKDILKFFPDFKKESLKELNSAYILRDMVPVLLMLYKDTEGEDIEILMDYATPQFRDYKSSSYFFDYAVHHIEIDTEKKKYFKVHSAVAAHDKYLKKMGFKRIENTDYFRKALIK
ncbi:MAG: hypothetical protein PF518_08505 [Spirochaetaceae bacterium]|jgi:hypothetical protein|nr:hypothetical protein [Spirochaetaceae bacterium]